MKRILFIFSLSLLTLNLAQAQVKAKYNTIDRKMGLNNTGEFKDAISIGFGMGATYSLTDLDYIYPNAENNLVYSIHVNKRMSKRISLQARANFGKLSGTRIEVNPDIYSSEYQSFNVSLRERIDFSNKAVSEESKIQFYLGLGAGFHTSTVYKYQSTETLSKGDQDRVNAPFLLANGECNLYLNDHFGLMAAIDYHQFFTDNIDLKVTNADNDAYLSTRFGICIKFY